MPQKFNNLFTLDSTVKILLLCVITLGGYLIYKLYYFSKQINHNTAYKIPVSFMIITSAIFSLTFTSLLYGLYHLDNPDILGNSIVLHLIPIGLIY